ncbi:GNAT family N-acetyltransferase [Peribacillus sp. SCS-155]|uniref:GNAT family N-acetyltransferase n=1 Tax=Peribacillus sedimenti TaxID=3115297 RepID=UPI003906D206
MLIRKITISDAESFLSLCKTLDQESAFMMLEPNERTATPDSQRQDIETLLLNGRFVILVCEHEDKLIGYITALREPFNRLRHSAYIVIGILQEFTGKGIGTALFKELEEWARLQKIHRLELTVMTHNAPAIHLYKKIGFEIEGTKKHSLIVDGQYVDEYYMAKFMD